MLTNGAVWRVFKIHFKQPIDKSLIFDLDLLEASPRNPQVVECIGNLSREGFTRPAMNAFFQQQQATSKFSLAALLLTEPVLKKLRQELRKLSPNVKVDEDYLKSVLHNDILKRDVVDSEEAKQAAAFVRKTGRGLARNRRERTNLQPEPPAIPTNETGAPGSEARPRPSRSGEMT